MMYTKSLIQLFDAAIYISHFIFHLFLYFITYEQISLDPFIYGLFSIIAYVLSLYFLYKFFKNGSFNVILSKIFYLQFVVSLFIPMIPSDTTMMFFYFGTSIYMFYFSIEIKLLLEDMIENK